MSTHAARGRPDTAPGLLRSTVRSGEGCAGLSMTHLNLFRTCARVHDGAIVSDVVSPRPRLVVIAFAVVCVVWGSTYLGIRVALTGFPPFFLGSARFLVAGAALMAF